MLVKATVNFSGKINMSRNEIRDIPEGDALKDLLRCGYVVREKSTDTAEESSAGAAESEQKEETSDPAGQEVEVSDSAGQEVEQKSAPAQKTADKKNAGRKTR